MFSRKEFKNKSIFCTNFPPFESGVCIAVGVQGCLRAQLVSRRERPDGQSGGAGEKQSSVS